MSFVLTAITMFIFWMLLSGETGIIFVISAVVSSLLVSYMSHDLLIEKKTRLAPWVRRTLKFFQYLPWLIYQIIIANFDLVYRTLHPAMPIDPCMIEFDTDLETDIGITILANSITLTPGTVTVKAGKDGKFLVHAIAKPPAQNLLRGEMQSRVKKIEE